MLIEEQALDFLVALDRERLEVEADPLLERAARDSIRKHTDHDDGQQRERDRHERQLPSDVQPQSHLRPLTFTTFTVSSTSLGGM